jgi:hypothetical protein
VAGVLVTLVLAKDFTDSYILFPKNNTLYRYHDVFTGDDGYQYARIFGQELL